MTVVIDTKAEVELSHDFAEGIDKGPRLVLLSGKAELEPLATKTFTTGVGELLIKANQHGLSHLSLAGTKEASWVNRCHSLHQDAMRHLLQAEREVGQYFAGIRETFTVPLAPQGTEFQQQVWQALLETKYGEVCSYSDIAQKIHRPQAVRAVGAANGANRIAIIIPCHRVIGKNGKLTGYAYGVEMKRKLLELEDKFEQKSIQF
ncbi:methylated-DNA--[protein]-cysteine S-methyltransferase [uncultured Shewanella sp.]|uniref:methylated-DNA--[protein]-cysteine S-methyltransferase n=1 Tax=Shewanella atlantica TaxID=271099 RepID=UPI00262CF2E5|nr:methylated-DNA--[protein]-cysteine S-methyltransferase [uncultured Shewanella sp.]